MVSRARILALSPRRRHVRVQAGPCQDNLEGIRPSVMLVHQVAVSGRTAPQCRVPGIASQRPSSTEISGLGRKETHVRSFPFQLFMALILGGSGQGNLRYWWHHHHM